MFSVTESFFNTVHDMAHWNDLSIHFHTRMKRYIHRYALICKMFHKTLFKYHLRIVVDNSDASEVVPSSPRAPSSPTAPSTEKACFTCLGQKQDETEMARGRKEKEQDEQWQGEGTCSSVKEMFLSLLNHQKSFANAFSALLILDVHITQ